jgi:hypothetical protein
MLLKSPYWLLFSLLLLLSASLPAFVPGDVAGRWDLTVGTGGDSYPSWLEVSSKDGKLSGRFVGRVGSARPEPSDRRGLWLH